MLLFAGASVIATPITIDFDDLQDGEMLGNQYSSLGVTFFNGLVLEDGSSLNGDEFPPRSGLFVTVDDGAPLSGRFGFAVVSLSFHTTYASPITLTILDIGGNAVASVTSLFAENYVSSGNPPNEWMGLSYPTGIYDFIVSGDPIGNSFAIDDFSFIPIATTKVADGGGVHALSGLIWAGLLLLVGGRAASSGACVSL